LELEYEAARVRIEAQLAVDAEQVRAAARAVGEREAELARATIDEVQEDLDRLNERCDAREREASHRSDEVTRLTSEIEALAATKGVLEGELEVLRGQIYDLRYRAVPDEERLAQLRRPWFAPHQLPAPGPQPKDEAAWLESLGQRIAQSGYTFHQRLLRAYHTSLKIAQDAPLTVLAGISGTGKSELPRLYAELGGVPFMELAVQPSWDSPHDLFGFFNYTDGRLRAEPLARLLHQIKEDEALRQGPVIVLLDEMNLARVEYYFSELLSKLEARRSALRSNSEDARRRASVHLDAGPGQADLPLFLDERVLFVGTMNEDESTLTLSDKVLDRACLLTFPAPRGMSLRNQGARAGLAGARLDWQTWTSWQRVGGAPDLAEKLNEVNRCMEELGRPFGHRLFRAIHAYIENYPTGAGIGADDAWSDQFAMKVIPRLRGLECGDREVGPRLKALRAFVPAELHDAFDRATSREFFAWEGAAALYQVGN
jgi:hypothetical protein